MLMLILVSASGLGSIYPEIGGYMWCDSSKSVLSRFLGKEKFYLAYRGGSGVVRVDLPSTWVPGWEELILGGLVDLAVFWLRLT